MANGSRHDVALPARGDLVDRLRGAGVSEARTVKAVIQLRRLRRRHAIRLKYYPWITGNRWIPRLGWHRDDAGRLCAVLVSFGGKGIGLLLYGECWC
jgi:hypothetical protein